MSAPFVITYRSSYSSLIPACAALVAAKRWPANITRWELEDSVFRGGGMALSVELPEHADIRAEFFDIKDQIAAIDAQREADAAAEAARIAALPPPVPFSVTPWQIRRALNQLGLRSTVEAAVAANQEAKDAWEYALEIRRDNELLTGMAEALSMSSEQLDDLFKLAATFP
jgi:hypothetical protein